MKQQDIAEEVSDLMLEYGAKLDQSLASIKERCDEKEFESYRATVSKLLTIMLTEVMNPLYKEHPDLKPKELE